MFIWVVPSKREVMDISPEKCKMLLSSKFNRTRVDGESHKSAGTVLTPGIVRGGDEPAERR
jgi:hypothetical protein